MAQDQSSVVEQGVKTRTSLYVVEDHPVVREGLLALLRDQANLDLVGASGDPTRALEDIRAAQPEVVVLDLNLGGNDGLILLKSIASELSTTKVLVFSMMSEAVYAERALRAGAVGYLMKNAETSELLNAIRMVSENRIYLGPKIFVSVFRGLLSRTPVSHFAGIELLSDRELQIFQLIGADLSNSEIGTRLAISTKTVEAHRENLKKKLKLSGAADLLRAAQEFVSDVYTNTR